MRPRGVLLLLALILVATVMFGIGAVVEKSSPMTTSAAVNQETSGAENHGETSAQVHAETAANQEAIFGFNQESTPLVVAAVLGSLGVFGAVWLYWRRALVLWIAGAIMAAFAVFDTVEIAHQVVEGQTTLVTIATTVAVLHVSAATMAVRLAAASKSMKRVTSS